MSQVFDRQFNVAEQGDQQASQKQSENSRFLMENCLAAVLTMTVLRSGDKPDTTVVPRDFDGQFGQETGDYLRKIGCERVSMTGDKLSLKLSAKHYEQVGQGGIRQARLSENVSCNLQRNGGTIELSNIKGIDLDFGRFSPWVGLPDLNLSRGNLALVLPLKNINISVPDQLYDNVSEMVGKLKR